MSTPATKDAESIIESVEQPGTAAGATQDEAENAEAGPAVAVERASGAVAEDAAAPPLSAVMPRRPSGMPVVTRRRVIQIGFWSSLGCGGI